MTPQLGRQRGVALISVLLVIVLLASLTYHLLSRHSMTIASSQQTVASAQLQEYALGGEAIARALIAADWERDQDPSTDHLEEEWAVPLEVREDGATVAIEIVDLMGRLNLNALVGDDANKRIRHVRALCLELGLDSNIGSLWADWVDPDDQTSTYGAEDIEYLGLEPPFRAANAPASHISETAAMLEILPIHLAQLMEYAVPLPTPEFLINANTASSEVLDSLIPADGTPLPLNVDAMSRTWSSVEEVLYELPMLTPSREVLVVASDYFEAHVVVTTDNAAMELRTVLFRVPETGLVHTQFRSFGRASLISASPPESDADSGSG